MIIADDLDASVRFYRDGLGLSLLRDRTVTGDWPGLFGASSSTLRAVFLGDPDGPDVHSGVLELNAVEGATHTRRPTSLRNGLFMLSFFVDVKDVLARLASLGLGGTPRTVEQSTPDGPVFVATVRDPDGVTILLTPGSITQRTRAPQGVEASTR